MANPALQHGPPFLSFGKKAPDSTRQRTPVLGKLSALPRGQGVGVMGEAHPSPRPASDRHTGWGVGFCLGLCQQSWALEESGWAHRVLRMGGS